MTTIVPTSLAAPRFLGVCDPEKLKADIRSMLSANNFFQLNFDAPWLERIFAAYQQPHRYFHTLNHLFEICRLVCKLGLGRQSTAELLLVALFHDVYWYPQGTKNEENSACVFDLMQPALGNVLPEEARKAIREIIVSSKGQKPISPIARRFHECDCDVFLHGTPVDLLAYEFQIFREFQGLSMVDYRKGREGFFNRFSRRFPECKTNMRFLVEYLERRRPRVGIYAGSFNPFHVGHMAILQKAELMFDKVIVAVGINPEKNLPGKAKIGDKNALKVRELLPFHEVIFFDNLMVDLLDKESEFCDVTLVRGLRNGYDLDYEMSQQCFMQEMRPETHSVYIPCDKSLEHISSSALRGLSHFDCHGKEQIYFPHLYDYYYQSIEELFL